MIVGVARGSDGRRNWLVAAMLMVWMSPLVSQELLDRIVARVDGYAITLSDVNAALALGVISVPPGGDQQSAAIERLIDRQLVLAEAARFAPQAPDPADVDREVEAMKVQAADDLAAVMRSTGVDEARIREMAADTLRIETYLAQRFGAAMPVSDEEVAEYFRSHPGEFVQGGAPMPFAEAEPIARERAAAERQAATIAQWLRDLRARSEIARPERGAP